MSRLLHIPLHGLISKDLCNLWQGVICLEHGKGLGQELQGLVADEFTGEEIKSNKLRC